MKVGDRVELKRPEQTRSERDELRIYPKGSEGEIVIYIGDTCVVRMSDAKNLIVRPENLRVCREVTS